MSEKRRIRSCIHERLCLALFFYLIRNPAIIDYNSQCFLKGVIIIINRQLLITRGISLFSSIGSFPSSRKDIVNYVQCANWIHSTSVHHEILLCPVQTAVPRSCLLGRTWKRIRVDVRGTYRDGCDLRSLALLSFPFIPRICTKWWGTPIDNLRTVSVPPSRSASLPVARL